MKILQKLAVALVRTRFRILALLSPRQAAGYAFRLFCTPQFKVDRELPAVFEQAEPLPFTFGSYTISGYRWNRGAARKVMIIHGFESSVINFASYVMPLVEKGYEVLAFDAPAHGGSSGRQINAVIYRDFIKHICSVYGPVQSFIAHSFGGLAVCLALAEMEHDAGSRLVLIAPATETATAFRQFFAFMQISKAAMKKRIEDIVIRISGHPVSWFSIRRTLPEINAQVLWVHDRQDTITPLQDTENIRQANYPTLQFVVTEGLGHRKIYRDAAVHKMVLDFL
ncbi:MAG: alpha/beta hydrolase [Chitinophagaceae bacterium]